MDDAVAAKFQEFVRTHILPSIPAGHSSRHSHIEKALRKVTSHGEYARRAYITATFTRLSLLHKSESAIIEAYLSDWGLRLSDLTEEARAKLSVWVKYFLSLI